jgi:hypothetical protein
VHIRRTRSVLIIALSTVAIVVSACGGGGDAGGGAAVSARPVQGKVTVTPENAAEPFALAKGNYRVNWKTTDCTAVTVVLTGDTGFMKEKKSSIPNFSWIVTSVPEGTYTAAQTDPACATWELAIEKV